MTTISSGPLIGPVIGSIRVAAGVSQAQLAESTRIANSQISKYELSLVVPTIDIAARLLAGLEHRLVVLPAGHAEGQRERQAVIDAAKRWGRMEAGESMTDGLVSLARAVQKLSDVADRPEQNPYAQIFELRSRLDQERRRVARLELALTTAVDLLREAGR